MVARPAARAERRVPRRPRDDPRRPCWAPRRARRPPTSWRRWSREVEAALDAGAIGPVVRAHLRARDARRDRRSSRRSSRPTAAARRAVRDAHAQRGRRACSRRSTRRSPRSARQVPAARLQVSHLKCGVARRLGPRRRGGRACSRRRAPTASTSPPTSTRTRRPPRPSRRSCRRRSQGLGVDDCVAALRRPARPRPRPRRDRAGHLGLGERRGRPGLGRHPDLVRREPPRLGRPVARRPRRRAPRAIPSDLAFDALIDDRLDVSIVIDCMDEPDVETIMAVPWIAVCTDAEGRRPGHPILDAGRPHPRTYGSTARVLGTYVRDRGSLSLETAVAKLTSRPGRTARPARPGRRPRGRLRRPRRLRSGDRRRRRRPTPTPARYPTGIDHVIVNGRAAIRRWRRDRRAAGPAAPAIVTPARCGGPRGRRCATVVATETAAVARLPGGPLAYTLRRSPRSRRPARRHPPGPWRRRDRARPRAGAAGRDPERSVDAFLAEREAWLRRHLAQPGPRSGRARRPRRAAGRRARSGFRGDLHRLRLEPARPGLRRSTVERIGGLDEDELVVRRRAGRPRIDRGASSRRGSSRGRGTPSSARSRRHAAGPRRHPGRGHRSATSGRAGGAPRDRAGSPSRGAWSSPRRRRSRRS